MKTIDLFRAAVHHLLKSLKIKQREIAIKLNPMYEPNTAASDFNNFLRERKNYSVEKQVKLAAILGHSYLDLLKIGERIIMREKREPEFIINGVSYSVSILTTMVKDILTSKRMTPEQKYLVEDIVRYWKHFKKRYQNNN